MQSSRGIVLTSRNVALSVRSMFSVSTSAPSGTTASGQLLGPAGRGREIITSRRNQAGNVRPNVAVQAIVQHEREADTRELGAGVSALQLLLQHVELTWRGGERSRCGAEPPHRQDHAGSSSPATS